ncbi:MAG: ABC transporter ATP-binding protein [Planctomycetes bacterium B3_Pla]|nr:MAG: ABC transporter ATP-binding protein [Planctomycetes bacterium B3_Pla]
MFLFRLKRTAKLGIKSLWMHKLRSSLTALGIIFGVSSVIAMLAIGEGASREAQEQIARLGSRNIIIKTVKPPEDQEISGQSQTMREYGLTYTDAERFRNSIPNVEVIVPSRLIAQQARYRNRKVAIEVIGTVPWYPEISPAQIQMGRFLSSIDLHHKQSVCVVDDQIVKELFVFDDPLGQDIKLSSDYYRVVGVVNSKNRGQAAKALTGETVDAKSQGGANVGNVYIPLTTVKNRFGEITLQFSGSTGRSIERVELQEITVKVGSTDEVLPTRDTLETLLARFHKKNDYQVTVPLELLKQAKATQRIFSIVLGSIAAISLLVGGIGIMNIMLATVSERTREIGIRRALGAKKRDIILQFLSETLILTLLGGILGISLGSFIPFMVTRFGNMRTDITGSSLVLAFGISGAVGIIFGLYPAYRAANMDPIESLRHE